MKKVKIQLPRLTNYRVGVYSSILLTLALVLFSSSLRAQQAEGRDPKTAMCPYMASQQGCLKSLSGKLDLTEEQFNRIQSIRNEFIKESGALKAEIQKKRSATADLFRDPEASNKKILAAQKEMAALKGKMMETAMNHRLKARGVLTPEQIRKIPADCWLGITPDCGGGGCGKGAACGKGGYHGKGKGSTHGKGGGGYGKCGRGN